MHDSDVLGEIFAAEVRPEQGPRNAGSKRKCLSEALRGRQICLQRIGLLSWAGPREQGELSWACWEGKALPEL